MFSKILGGFWAPQKERGLWVKHFWILEKFEQSAKPRKTVRKPVRGQSANDPENSPLDKKEWFFDKKEVSLDKFVGRPFSPRGVLQGVFEVFGEIPLKSAGCPRGVFREVVCGCLEGEASARLGLTRH